MILSGEPWEVWMIFYHNNYKRLQAHFDAGGTLDMLNSTKGPKYTALYYCCSECADEECLPILMKYGARPDDTTWKLALTCAGRALFIKAFIEHGFWPKKEHVSVATHPFEVSLVTIEICKKTIIAILQCKKKIAQPWSHLWGLIARCLWSTRKNLIWLDNLY